MHAHKTDIYDLIFTNWTPDSMNVQIASPVLIILQNYFGEDGDIVLDMQDLIQRYTLASRDITDFIEMSNPDIPMDAIFEEVHGVLKRVLNLDAATRHLIRDSL